MVAFDYRTLAELFPTKGRGFSRQPAGYGRFAHAAHAIRFAIEELHSQLLPDACIEVNAERFDRDGIRRLYDIEDYPLVRRVPPVGRAGQSNIRSDHRMHPRHSRQTDGRRL